MVFEHFGLEQAITKASLWYGAGCQFFGDWDAD